MKQKVLIFIDWFSPGYKAGGPTTSNVNIVDHLSDKFEFYILTSDTDYHADAPYPDIVSNTWVDRENCHVWYFSKSKLSLSAMTNAIKEADCPVWYINGIYSRYFSLYPLIIAKSIHPGKIIVSARGMLSPHAIAVKPLIKKIFLKTVKSMGLYRNVLFHGTNENECDHIRNRIGKNKNCLPIENLPRKLNMPFNAPSKIKGTIRLVSFARISSEKNTLYAIRTLAKCKNCVKYDIYGQINSESYWEECRQAISELPDNVTVKYHGSVHPSMLSEIYKTHDALYLPTTGENFGHAILESFMNSRPVIISNRTPWQNLTNKGVGFDIPLEDPMAFSIAVDKLADETPEDFDAICKNTYDYAETICNNRKVVEKYVSMFSANKYRQWT